MSKTSAWTIIIIIVLAILGAVVYTKGSVGQAPTKTDDVSMNMTDGDHDGDMMATSTTSLSTTTATTTRATLPSNAKQFTVNGANFSFTPSTISVKKGDTVVIHFVNTGGFHDFKIDDFTVATPRINGGQTADITFVASKVGSFEYYCSVGSHRAMGMKGTLTVTQ